MTDTERVKVWRDAKRKPCPDGCGKEVAYRTVRCRTCHGKRHREQAINRTVLEVKSENNSLRWSDHVRMMARAIHSFKKCAVCGYGKHVEIAHIRPISDFPDSATIKEINDLNNVVGLCPNHHWEFDNGLLKLVSDEGI